MRYSFRWQHKKLPIKEYHTIMGIHSKSEKEDKKNFKAYEVAEDVRKFEIDKYWQRTLYFWGMITAVYVAYFNVLKDITTRHGSVPLIVLSGLGLFFCFSWLLASKGSKHWQENWENHIAMLEDDITGPLFKIYKANTSYSVSGINIVAGWVLSFCAFGLFIFELAEFIKKQMKLFGLDAFLLLLLFTTFTGFALFAYSQIVKGNSKKSGKIEFDIKEFENLSTK